MIQHLYQPGVSGEELAKQRCVQTGDIEGALWLASPFVQERLLQLRSVGLTHDWARLHPRHEIKCIRKESKQRAPRTRTICPGAAGVHLPYVRWLDSAHRVVKGKKRTTQTRMREEQRHRHSALVHRNAASLFLTVAEAIHSWTSRSYPLSAPPYLWLNGRYYRQDSATARTLFWSPDASGPYRPLFCVRDSHAHLCPTLKQARKGIARRTRVSYRYLVSREQRLGSYIEDEGERRHRMRSCVWQIDISTGRPQPHGWGLHTTGHLRHINPNPGCEADVALITFSQFVRP